MITDRTDKNICRFFIAFSLEISRKSLLLPNAFCGYVIINPMKNNKLHYRPTSSHKNILLPKPSAPSPE
jgi:hypothetical protein